MSFKTQLKKGKKVEREHLPYYHQIKKKFSKTGKCPTDSQFAEGIAKEHISENPKYYDKLIKAGL
jgi:hypothetical protein